LSGHAWRAVSDLMDAEDAARRQRCTSHAVGGRGRVRRAKPFPAIHAAPLQDARPRERTRRGSGPDGTSWCRTSRSGGRLEAPGATSASVPFTGRAGRGGRVDRIMLHRLDGDEPVDVEWWTSRDELCYALEAPVWNRFGSFAGQPRIAGTILWTTADRRVVIEGRRGAQRFEEAM
jgi:hypothetical protein